jgi:hypothetical protein
VEPFDVVEDIYSRFGTRLVLPPVDPVALEQAEEAFGGCIVRAASHAAHTALKVVPLQEPLVFIARKLTASIRVKHDGTSIRSLPQRHQDGLQYELCVLAGAHRPANDATRVEVHHNGQVEPAFGSSDVRDIGDPLRIGFVRSEVSSQVVLNVIRPSARWLRRRAIWRLFTRFHSADSGARPAPPSSTISQARATH